MFSLLTSGNLHAAPTVLIGSHTNQVALASSIEFLEDQDGTLEITDVSSTNHHSAFQDFHAAGSRNEVNFGYSGSVYWLRWTVDAQSPMEMLLEVGFPSLDHVDFYTEKDGAWQVMKAGDLEPFSARPIVHRNFVFPVNLDHAGKTTMYLRVASLGSLTVPLTLWQPAAFDVDNQESYAVHALYFGILLAMVLYNLMLYFSLRDQNYLIYVSFVVGNAIGQASLFGFGNQYLWPSYPAWGNVAVPVGYALAGLFGSLFVRAFLDTKTWAPRHNQVLLVLVAWFAFTIISPVFLSYRWAAICVSLGGVAVSVVAVSSAIICLRQGCKGARIFLLAWTLLLAGVAVLGLRNMNVLPTNFFTLHAMMMGSALEMVLLSFALADRIHVIRREKELAQNEALAAERTVIENLQRLEVVLEQQIEERTRELSESNAQLRESEARFRSMADSAPLMIWVAGPDKRISWVNKGWLYFTGCSMEQKLGATRLELVHPEDRMRCEELYARYFDARESFNMEYRLKRHDGAYRWILDSGGPRFDAQGQFVGYIGSCVDISDRKFSEEIIWTQANYDVLTGLPNRRLFLDRLHQETKKTQRAGHLLALLFIDLDRFKEVNDTFGHQVGDALLVEASNRIGSCVRETDTVARLGGDEFTVILPDLSDLARVDGVAQELVRILSAPFLIKELELRISASVGIGIYPADADDVDRLIRVADKAMYAAKNQGRNCYCRADGVARPVN